MVSRDPWEVDDAVRTLVRAEEIKKDLKMMKRVKAAVVKKKAALSTISKSKTKPAASRKKKRARFGAR